MIRRFYILLVSIAVAAQAYGRTDFDRIHLRGELIVGTIAEDAAPFVITGKDGKLSGIDIDLARKAAEEMGVKVKFVRGAKTYDQLIDQLAAGMVDIAIGAIYPTLKRSQAVIFTDAYWYAVPVTIFNRVEKARLSRKKEGMQFLNEAGVRLGVFGSAGSMPIVSQLYPKAAVVAFDNRAQMQPALMKGEIAAAYVDEVEELRWRQSIKNMDLFLGIERDEKLKREVTFAVNPADQQLWHWVNRFIRVQEHSGFLKSLRKKYFEGAP